MRAWTVVVLAAVVMTAGVSWAGPPIPLHQLEGSGGAAITEMAYLVNPSEGEEPLGMPAFSFTTLLAKNKSLNALTVSETLFKRLELSYSFHRFHLGDWVSDTNNSNIHDNIYMHVFNARVALLNEGEHDLPWLPAVTAGFHYKRNIRIHEMDRDLGSALSNLGMRDTDGEEYTLTATKMIEGVMENPLLVSATLRNTDAAHAGYVGFTHDRQTVIEGNIAYFLRDNLILCAEYREKPDKLNHTTGVGDEDDWWTLAASYIVNNNCSLTVAYANLGTMLNHEEPWAVWMQLKYEL